MIDCEDNDRFVHEPRALWTVVRQQAAEAASGLNATRVLVDKDHLRNVGRHPITLTHLSVCPINYFFRDFDNEVTGLSDVHNSQNILNVLDWFASAPYSVHITSRDGRIALRPAEGRANPGMLYTGVGAYASDLFGVSRWAFDKPLSLPRGCEIQFDLSTFTLPNLGFSSPFPTGTMVSAVSFDEVHTGIFGGNNRLRERAELPPSNPDGQGAPFGLDGFASVQGTSMQRWPAEGVFPSRIFSRQETNRGQERNSFAAFNVHFDQIDSDVLVQKMLAPAPDHPISPASTRIAVRARVANGGSREWWWRPGAPVCLVCPTITPALVAELAEPITLGPGEQLEGEVQIPVGPQVAQALYQPTYQLGISLTGYASIEG